MKSLGTCFCNHPEHGLKAKCWDSFPSLEELIPFPFKTGCRTSVTTKGPWGGDVLRDSGSQAERPTWLKSVFKVLHVPVLGLSFLVPFSIGLWKTSGFLPFAFIILKVQFTKTASSHRPPPVQVEQYVSAYHKLDHFHFGCLTVKLVRFNNGIKSFNSIYQEKKWEEVSLLIWFYIGNGAACLVF